MEIDYIAIGVATVLQFVAAAVWYTGIFGKLWGKMHGFENVPPEEQKVMQKKMMPFLALQLVLTLVTTFVFALFVTGLSTLSWNVYGIAGFVWLGFVVPTQASAVIFGGTPPQWVVKKIAVMSGSSLAGLMIAAAVLQMM